VSDARQRPPCDIGQTIKFLGAATDAQNRTQLFPFFIEIECLIM
jgi:hypothetical protein